MSATGDRREGAVVLAGVGPDEKIVENEDGYRASKVHYRIDLIPADAVLHVGGVMCEGATGHGENNWSLGTLNNHLNKALIHAFAYMAGDRQDDHIGHFATRSMMALAVYLRRGDVDFNLIVTPEMREAFKTIAAAVEPEEFPNDHFACTFCHEALTFNGAAGHACDTPLGKYQIISLHRAGGGFLVNYDNEDPMKCVQQFVQTRPIDERESA